MGIYINSPCLGCKERHLVCWDSCDKYLDYKDLNASINAARLEYREGRSVEAEMAMRQKSNKVKF